MAKRVSTRRVKKHRLYKYDEAGDALGVTSQTVRSWRSHGLKIMTAGAPHFILGAELIAFLEEKQAKKSVSLGDDQMYCFRCKAAQKPLLGMVDYIPIYETIGRLAGLCEVCEGSLQRFASKADLGKYGQIYDLTIKSTS